MRWLRQKCLPPICIFCGDQTQSKENICADCLKNLPILAHTCPQCAQIISGTSDDLLCGDCLKTPPPFDKTYALFPYEPPIIQLITALKFRHELSHAQALGDLLAVKITKKWYINQYLPDIILPIPLHFSRLSKRGFNQAVEIAKPIAKQLNIPLDLSTKRIRPTLAQSSLNAKARQHNVANAFVASKDYSNLCIAVIDDVVTTGHTVTEFCRLLRQHGAKEIHIWCGARRL